ncbi:hypothetical protein [Paracoccus versutus]|uniref:Uncharacterized protein n=1 Tax=Paracoccus versutus TaxID=34007 RepID=A0A3D9XSY2_PARVE|nr:hypothetical protein [Paracoccus versutus]REF73505.1 hypothetical protein BDD41_2070 [Paracoccus versutus]WGR54778.1 hypothetical protein E3U25_01450 [Paracoccus versutus]
MRGRDHDTRQRTMPKDSAFQAPLSFSFLLRPYRNVGYIAGLLIFLFLFFAFFLFYSVGNGVGGGQGPPLGVPFLVFGFLIAAVPLSFVLVSSFVRELVR